jgi:hypothetical protein
VGGGGYRPDLEVFLNEMNEKKWKKRKTETEKSDGSHTETEGEAVTDGDNISSRAHLKCDFAFVPDSLYRVDTRYK